MWRNLQRLLPITRNVAAVLKTGGVTASKEQSPLSTILPNRFIHSLGPYAERVGFLEPWKSSKNETGDLCINSAAPNQVTPYAPSRGLKIKGRVQRRCKDCQLIWEDGVLWNRCKTHPRHKQKLKQQYWPNLRIITHYTAGTKRPW